MLTSALFLGSTLLMSRSVPPLIDLPPLLPKISALGCAGYVVSLGLGLRLLRAINKSGHLDRRKKD
jgi:ubiquinone biosynthesis protein